jgi:hypothetical protein
MSEQKYKTQSRSQIKNGLLKLFSGQSFHMENSEDFDGNGGGIWMSGESDTPYFKETFTDDEGSFDFKSEVFNYYNESYVFGVHPKLHKWLAERGWFGEWHDAGTMFLWKI